MGVSAHTGRRHDIDVIRVVLFGALIVYHTGLIFGTRSWFLNADTPSRAVDLLLLSLHPWRLGLLFLISGISTAALAKRLGPGDIRSMRSRQLIPPLLFGIFVLVPPQIYIALKAASGLGFDMSYLNFWALYAQFGSITLNDGGPTSLVSLQHLWFIAYLWLYTVVLTSGMALASGLFSSIAGRVERLTQGRGLLVWPILYLAGLRLTLFPLFGETMDVGTDWYAHAVYFSLFAFGYLIADSERFWAAVVERRRQAALVAAVSLVGLGSLLILCPPDQRSIGAVVLYRIVRAAFQWSAIVAILGWCRVLIVAPHPVVTYLNKAVLTCYVVHQTALLVFAYWWTRNFGFGIGSFLIIVIATMVSCLLAYEAQRYLLRLVRAGVQRVVADPTLQA